MPTRHQDISSQKVSLGASFSVGIILSVLVGVMWFYLNLNYEKNLRELVHLEAKKYSALIDGDIRSRLPALQRIVSRWEARGQMPKDEFTFDAEAYIRDLPGFQALEWVDNSFHIRWVVPFEGNEKAQDLNLAFEEERRVALEKARDERGVTMSKPVDLIQGGKGILIYFPIDVDGKFEGYLLAVLKITPWLDFAFKINRDVSSFNAIVSIDGEQVYGQQRPSTSDPAEWGDFSLSQILNHEIRVEVVPTETFFIKNLTYIPEFFAGAGLLLTVLISYMIFLYQKTSLVTANTQTANSLLESEIQERKKTELSLNEALQLNHSIFANSPVGILIYDKSGACISANAAISHIIGSTHEQVMALNYNDADSWKQSGLTDLAHECQRTGEGIRREVNVTSSFGQTIIIDCHLVPINVRNDSHLLLMVSDVSETRKIQNQLVQASKMATLGEMATGVAHELNQPLNVISMAVNNIKRKLKQSKASPEYLNGKLGKVEKQVERAAAIINHMRIFGRKVDEQPQLLSPEKVIKDTLGLIGEQLRLASIDVNVTPSTNKPRFKGHQVQVEQVLLNLLSNARDVLRDSPNGNKYINICVEDGKDAIRITVEDSGGGVDPDVLPRIFEPFYTTKEIGRGTGLGLSISYGIITDMGGMIEAENTDHGARFTISLPQYNKDKTAT